MILLAFAGALVLLSSPASDAARLRNLGGT
jgi:hypothetical protein